MAGAVAFLTNLAAYGMLRIAFETPYALAAVAAFLGTTLPNLLLHQPTARVAARRSSSRIPAVVAVVALTVNLLVLQRLVSLAVSTILAQATALVVTGAAIHLLQRRGPAARRGLVLRGRPALGVLVARVAGPPGDLGRQ